VNDEIREKNITQDMDKLAYAVAHSLDRHLRHKGRWLKNPTLTLDLPFKVDALREFIQVTVNLKPSYFGRTPESIEENSAMLLALCSCLGDIPEGHETFGQKLSEALGRDPRFSSSYENDLGVGAFWVALNTEVE
jgi:hypothetical protein